jgi:hypothetical protein
MRISNEERREVARKLRSLDERIEGMPLMCTKQEHNDMALRAIRAVVGKGDIFHLLADLIDRPTTKRDDVGGIYWCCPRCGAFNRKDAVTDCSSVIQSRYCANCGAVVVSDDD